MCEAGLPNTRRYVTVPTRAGVLMRATVFEPEVWVLGDTAITLPGSWAVVGMSSGLTALSHRVGREYCLGFVLRPCGVFRGFFDQRYANE